jgi:hypothetical protein
MAAEFDGKGGNCVAGSRCTTRLLSSLHTRSLVLVKPSSPHAFSDITVVFPKEGQLAERYAIKHGLWLRRIGRRYALRRRRSEPALRVTVSKLRFEIRRSRAALRVTLSAAQSRRYALRGLPSGILRYI